MTELLHRLHTLLRRAVVSTLVATVSATVLTWSQPAAAMAPDQTDVASVVWYLAGNSPGSIEEFWSRNFAAWGLAYSSPRVYFYNSPSVGDYDVTGCGNTSARHWNGFHCEYTHGIYLDYFDQNDRINPGGRYTFGDGEAAAFLAHEWGHHVQALLGYPMDSYRAEYHADCLAGMYERYGYATGRLTGGDYWEFHNWLLSTPQSTTHGSPYYRTLWYRFGWDRYDINACNLAYR